MQKAMSFNNVAIIYVKGNAYKIHFWYMSKDDAINIMNNSNLVDKMSVLEIFFIIYQKMSECNFVKLTYYQRNKDVI